MALKDFFAGLIGQKTPRMYAKILNGEPVFTAFGDNVYSSDVVQMAIGVIATECSKLQPRHIRIGENGTRQEVVGSLNRIFKFAPNPLMTTRDFLEKVIWMLHLNYNAFIYPMFDVVTAPGKPPRREYTAFYPLNPYQVDFLQDDAGTLFVHMFFRNGTDFSLPYSDIIHLRMQYSQHDILGGGINGQPDNAALLQVLETNNIVMQGIGKAIKTSLSVRGVMKISTMADDDKQRAERARFEALLETGKSGILPVDLKGDFLPISLDPKVIDKETMQFLQDTILNYYGVSLPIITGKYNDEDYQAFYEKKLEPLVISLGQAFSKCLFTNRELDVGNEIMFYGKNMMYLSTKSKTELLKIAGEQGLMSDDQKLELLGYPPLPNGTGNRRTQSLNYIDTTLINDYQLTKAKSGGIRPDPQPSQDGGTQP